jgi:hypothetical protein
MTQTVAALFDDPGEAKRVLDDLQQSGFDPQDIGLVAPDIRSESQRMLGGTWKGLAIGTLAGTLVAVSAIVIPGIGPAFVAGPFGVLAGAAVGGLAGGLVGALRGSGLSESDARFYAEGVRRGGILVTVAADTAERADRAAEIMQQHHGAVA